MKLHPWPLLKTFQEILVLQWRSQQLNKYIEVLVILYIGRKNIPRKRQFNVIKPFFRQPGFLTTERLPR